MKSSQTQNLKASSILALFLIIFGSCEKNDEDQLLKDQLIGTWKSTNSYYKSYTFNKDNTFIDTAYYLTNIHPFEYKVLNIISGDYLIANGQIKFSNIQLVYFEGQEDDNTVGYTTGYEPLYNISFEGEVLVLKQMDLFESINNANSSIIGKWSHDKLVAVYDKQLENKFTGGILRGLYDFKPDLSVSWQYETIYDHTVNPGYSTTTYDLTDSNLSINQWGLYNLNVAFTKNRMTWTYPNKTFDRQQ